MQLKSDMCRAVQSKVGSDQMIWFTLRRWRISIVIALVLTGVLVFMTLHIGFDYENETATSNQLNCATVEVASGYSPSQAAAQFGYTGPPITPKLYEECNKLSDQTSGDSNSAYFFEGLLIILPILLAIMLAAPVVAEEYRRKTHRVLWTQSVSRVRWFGFTFGTILVISLVLLVPFFALTSWHEHVFASQFHGAIAPWQFEVSGFNPVALLIFAASLAVLFGVIFRFTIPALMATLLFAGFAPWGAEALRFRIFGPVTTAISGLQIPQTSPGQIISGAGAPSSLQGAYLLNGGWAPHNLVVLPTTPVDPYSCFDAAFANGVEKAPSNAQILQCFHSGGWHLLLLTEPANRFWTMQIAQSALFLALAAVCIGLSLWLIKRGSR
jgi:hypothetical protein